MADQPMDGGPQAGGYLAEQDFSAGTMVNLAGAAVSLALLVGVGVWGYQLVARDVSGVPVVRAAEGEMRISPKNPGGQPAAHQGLAVNEVAVDGLASEPVDQLTLAPPPITLDNEDAPMETSVALPDGDAQASAAPVGGQKPEGMSDEQFASIQALADQLAAGSAPLANEEATPAPVTPTPAVAVQPEEEAPEPVAEVRPEPVEGGIGRSLRPRARPANLVANAAAAQDTVARAAIDDVTSPAATPGAAEVSPELIPAGTRLVQLGAYASREIALSEWDRLGGKFTDYLDGKLRVVQKATSGGRVFYRLRAMGFADLSDARRFCSALMAEGADCIPVVTR